VGQARVRKLNGTQAKGPQRTVEFKQVDERELAMQEENALLARTEALIKLANLSEEDKQHVAWHESAHAVIYEVLSDGVSEATIVPIPNDQVMKPIDTGVSALGQVMRVPDLLPVNERRRCLHFVAGLLAGGLATEKALGYKWGTDSDDAEINRIVLNYMNLRLDEAIAFVREAGALCEAIMAEPKVWKAIEEVKEALLTEKTIDGDLVRAIVKKQERPELFPVEISKQLSFHFRQNYIATDSQNGRALYVLTLGGKSCVKRNDGTVPPYVEAVIKNNVQPIPNFLPEAVQLRLLLSQEEQLDSHETTGESLRLINCANNREFALRENLANVDNLLITTPAGQEIEIPKYIPRLSVVIESHEGNVMTFGWRDILFTVNQDGFEFDLGGMRGNSIGVLLVDAINECAGLNEEPQQSKQEEWPLKAAA
jgi:hypothetical protein